LKHAKSVLDVHICEREKVALNTLGQMALALVPGRSIVGKLEFLLYVREDRFFCTV